MYRCTSLIRTFSHSFSSVITSSLSIQPGSQALLLSNVQVPPNPGQPLLMGPQRGTPTRAPTVFMPNLGVVPPPITPQLLQNPAAGLPPYFIHQQQHQFATQQPINLGMGSPQIGGTGVSSQQISGGIHSMPHMMTSVPSGATNQVPANAGYNSNRVQRSTAQPKRSKAVKIIDPNTKKEVSVSDSKADSNQTTMSDAFTARPTPAVTMAAPTSGTSSSSSHVAEDFKRMVTQGLAPQGHGASQTTSKPAPPPNAIITDPTTKVAGDQNRTQKESKDAMTVQKEEEPPEKQQAASLAPADVPVSRSESPNPVIEEFRHKVQQSMAATPETEVHESKNGEQDSKLKLEVKDGQIETEQPATDVAPTTSAPADGVSTVEELKAVTVDEKEVKSDSTEVGDGNVHESAEETLTDVQPTQPVNDVVEKREEDTVIIPETAAPTTEGVVEPASEVVKPVPEPVPEPVSEPALELVAEPVPEPTSKPVSEPVSESVIEPITEPVSETPASEPVPETPVSEPVPETPVSGNEEESQQIIETKEADDEARASVALDTQLPQEETATEDNGRPMESSQLPSLAPEADETRNEVKTKPETEEIQEEESAPVTAVVQDAPPVEIPLVDKEEVDRTKQPINSESESAAEPQTGVVDQQDPSLSSDITATEGDQPRELPTPAQQEKPVQLEEHVQQEKPVHVARPVEPVEQGEVSPPTTTATKTKEVAKPAEPVVTAEKHDKPASAVPSGSRNPANVPGTGEHLLELRL